MESTGSEPWNQCPRIIRLDDVMNVNYNTRLTTIKIPEIKN
jgi:hypothetical protein